MKIWLPGFLGSSYRRRPLTAEGWDVIVFIPSKEEDADRITCGNALLAINNFGAKE